MPHDGCSDDEYDEYVAIGRQFGLFFRRAERFYQSISFDTSGPALERAAYGVLGRIATGGPERLSTLAGELCVDMSTASRQVAALETAGLVRKAPDPTDRRASLIEITLTGAKVLAAHRERWLGALKQLMADWTPAERREFARLFARLNEAMETEAVKKSETTETEAMDKKNEAMDKKNEAMDKKNEAMDKKNEAMEKNSPASAGMERE
ncbi:MarR family winged helix-turn-helix transcriptional regulator [Planosporangium sp. 12N6]|uniref:MarR family winged helix-turn-helix transcriptional regulator n=1 Tax=Planosporangium spinosum TaxID=3402278 RepID=UPI003CE9B13F